LNPINNTQQLEIKVQSVASITTAAYLHEAIISRLLQKLRTITSSQNQQVDTTNLFLNSPDIVASVLENFKIAQSSLYQVNNELQQVHRLKKQFDETGLINMSELLQNTQKLLQSIRRIYFTLLRENVHSSILF